jgi:hypothetical protein
MVWVEIDVSDVLETVPVAVLRDLVVEVALELVAVSLPVYDMVDLDMSVVVLVTLELLTVVVAVVLVTLMLLMVVVLIAVVVDSEQAHKAKNP